MNQIWIALGYLFQKPTLNETLEHAVSETNRFLFNLYSDNFKILMVPGSGKVLEQKKPPNIPKYTKILWSIQDLQH